jgi:hexosaminidase
MVLPRMTALSEVQWTNADKKNYKSFTERLPRMLNIFQRDGLNYAKHVYDIDESCQIDTTKKCITETLSTIDNAPIYYTTDGTEPTKASTAYSAPIKISESCTLNAIAIRPSSKSNILTKEFAFNKATMCPIKLNVAPQENYTYKGASVLNDGLKGTENFASGRWLGFYNRKTVEATIDLGSEQEINQVSVEALISLPSYIMGATYVAVATSNDGVNFTEVGNMDYPEDTDSKRIDIDTYDVAFPPTNARYVKVIITPTKALPKEHEAAGEPTFLFIDEISVD